MNKIIYTPTEFSKNIYENTGNINGTNSEVEIINENTNNSVVALDSNYWKETKETLYLYRTGVLDVVKER